MEYFSTDGSVAVECSTFQSNMADKNGQSRQSQTIQIFVRKTTDPIEILKIREKFLRRSYGENTDRNHFVGRFLVTISLVLPSVALDENRKHSYVMAVVCTSKKPVASGVYRHYKKSTNNWYCTKRSGNNNCKGIVQTSPYLNTFSQLLPC